MMSEVIHIPFFDKHTFVALCRFNGGTGDLDSGWGLNRGTFSSGFTSFIFLTNDKANRLV